MGEEEEEEEDFDRRKEDKKLGDFPSRFELSFFPWLDLLGKESNLDNRNVLRLVVEGEG